MIRHKSPKKKPKRLVDEELVESDSENSQMLQITTTQGGKHLAQSNSSVVDVCNKMICIFINSKLQRGYKLVETGITKFEFNLAVK